MSNSPVTYVTALYIRLSTEDSKVGSFSIENQTKTLHQYVDAMEGVNNAEVLEFIDNGYSGTNFAGPAFVIYLILAPSAASSRSRGRHRSGWRSSRNASTCARVRPSPQRRT